MSLAGGDLTTPARAGNWIANPPPPTSTILQQLIGSMTALIYGKLNRARLYSQTFTRTFDGAGTMQLVLPDWPVTAISSIQQGQNVIQPSILPSQGSTQPAGSNPYYGYRFVPWTGYLPGDPCVIELVCGHFWPAAQNVRVTYTAGYLIQAEAQIVPFAPGPYIVQVLMPQGVWCRDGGVTYTNGTALSAVSALTAAGQYIPPTDSCPGVYTFFSGDAGAAILISYSFIPADLEEACIQMVAERYSYRSRIGELSKSLGGQETVSFMRGNRGGAYGSMNALPPEVMDLINPYISVIPPAIGAPV